MYTPGEKYNLYELLQKADKGDLAAMETVVSLLIAEGYTDDDPYGEIAKRQVRYLRHLAEAGETFAYIMLGDAYKKGDGTAKDVKEAIHCYEQAAADGIRFGNECIGLLYYEGDDISADYKKAYEYFTKDAEKKSFCTTYALGEMFRKGLYVSRDEEKACEYYKAIVYDDGPFPERDDYYWRACYRLAMAHHYGQGVEKDLDTAVELMAKARNLYESRGENAVKSDISKVEFYQEWLLLNQDAGAF